MRSTLTIPVLVFLLTAGGCGNGEKEEDHFLEPCFDDTECPVQWVCPKAIEPHNGTMTEVCTPQCTLDTQCEEILEREDVMCFVAGFCALSCSSHEECPEILPFCRGSHPDCEGYRPWCAREDYECPPP